MNNCNLLKQAATWFVLLMVEKNESACASREEDGNPQMQRMRILLVIFERKKWEREEGKDVREKGGKGERKGEEEEDREQRRKERRCHGGCYLYSGCHFLNSSYRPAGGRIPLGMRYNTSCGEVKYL